MGSILGGSQTSETKIPAWMEDQAKHVIDRGNRTSEIGYMPFYGPEVAALSPLEEAAMRNTSSAANAFGLFSPESNSQQLQTAPVNVEQTSNPAQAQVIQDMYRNHLGRDPDAEGFKFWMDNYNPDTFAQDFKGSVQVDPLTGLPAAGNFNGMRGYSSAPMFEGAMAELKARRPGQYGAMMDMFVDPQTGADSVWERQRKAQQQQQAQGLLSQFVPDYGGAGDHGYGGGVPANNGPDYAGGFFGGIGDAVGSIGGFFGGPSERW